MGLPEAFWVPPMTVSPGRTRSQAPVCAWSSGISSSLPSARIRRAVGGASLSGALLAAEVEDRALSSRICPSRVSETMTAQASKWSPTRPCSWNDCGNCPSTTFVATLYRNTEPTLVPISVPMLGLRVAIDGVQRT